MDWSTHYDGMGQIDPLSLIERPDEWQLQLAEKIRSLAGTGNVLEAGCGFGVTSLLLGPELNRTLLDLEPKAIAVSRQIFLYAGQCAEFKVADIFSTGFPDGSFDLVFNAGVLEHFDMNGRREALREMARVTKPGGVVCVAIPNHYSVPYRFAYEYRKAHGIWPYPDEERIFDLSEELSGMSDLIADKRETVGEKAKYHFLSKFQKIWFKFLNLFVHYEGYLTILTFYKNGEKEAYTVYSSELG
ncbi:MAG: class I SAM-dependent methyltransferase [Geobacter sp.]|jgi:ubiquinone/menaquinone biosynthesis C-methylase UbiE|nr:class I SAM-dependent methyltransferase [Geobacter sp.]